MNTESVLAELQDCDKELQRQRRLKRRRRILRLLLVGFLVGKDADKRISELTAKRDSALECVRARLAEIESTHAEISDIANSNTLLGEIQQKQWISVLQSLERDFSLFKKSGILDGITPKYGELLSDCFEKMLLQTKELVRGEISRKVRGDTYLTYPDKEQLANTLKTCQDYLTYCGNSGLISGTSSFAASQDLELHRKLIDDYNAQFVEERKRQYAYLFMKEKFCLDEEQKTAVVTDDKYNLVVAAAGSGKTEVLITRIAYLIERRPDSVKPNRILAIAFQKKAVEEIKNRLFERFNVSDVNVMTFHKLGKDIVEKNRGKKLPHNSIVGENKPYQIIKEIYDQKIKTDPTFYTLFLSYMRFYNVLGEPTDKESILVQKRLSAYVSIDNTRVQSKAEKEIMDFFLTHKIDGKRIKIEYEPVVAEFLPDFRLTGRLACGTEFEIYIEHWGINEKGQTPDWFSQPPEKYREKMKKEREWFQRNDKVLVETFSYEYDEEERQKFIALVKERVLQRLKEKYNSEFEFAPMNYEEIVEVAWAPYQDQTPKNIENFIKNAKVYGLTPDRVKEKLRSGKWSPKQISFGLLALEVYRSYQQVLRQDNKIDFEDMINEAAEALRQSLHLCYDEYDHILVDEYQDISEQRNKLIGLLLERNPKCKLLCVGDDWQSIMGFAGSNVNFFVNFAEFYQHPAISPISTNYRSQKTIVEAGAALIRYNGQNQVPKATTSNKNLARKIRVVCSDHEEKKYESRYIDQTAKDCADRIKRCIENGIPQNEILVLSRYKFPRIVQLFEKEAKERNISISFDKEQLKKDQIRLMTAHKSKGLQARVVFILNVIKDRYGFPCELEDSSIFEPVRENYPKQDQKQEERRLFYVAMTRAMEDLVVYTWKLKRSQFLKEIEGFIEEEPLHYWNQKN